MTDTTRIKNELEQVTAALVVAHPKDQTGLFMAQQALAWVLKSK